jgi:putative phosphoesterase
VEALAGSELIIHAGDVGRPEILDRLRAMAPVFAVRGNVDHGAWAEALPETALVDVAGVRIYVLHDVHALGAASGFDVVVSGHSHKPREEWRDGVLYVNPGSAGPRRFRLPITVAKLDLRKRPWRVDFSDLRAG